MSSYFSPSKLQAKGAASSVRGCYRAPQFRSRSSEQCRGRQGLDSAVESIHLPRVNRRPGSPRRDQTFLSRFVLQRSGNRDAVDVPVFAWRQNRGESCRAGSLLGSAACKVRACWFSWSRRSYCSTTVERRHLKKYGSRTRTSVICEMGSLHRLAVRRMASGPGAS